MGNERHIIARRGVESPDSARGGKSINCYNNVSRSVGWLSSGIMFVTMLLLMITMGSSYAYARTIITNVGFEAINRCTYADTTFTTASNAGNQYALAVADLSGLNGIDDATSIALDFYVTISSGQRLFIGIGDKSVRGTTANGSSKVSYVTDGLATYYGSNDNSRLRIGTGTSNLDLFGKCTLVHFEWNKATSKYSLKITDCSNSANILEVSDASVPDGVNITNIVEIYSWAGSQKNAIGAVKCTYKNSEEEPVITFLKGDDSDVEGKAPEAFTCTTGYYTSSNPSLYKPGYSFSSWTDDNNTFNVGSSYFIEGDMTMSPNFVANTVSLIDITEAVVVDWSALNLTATSNEYIVKQVVVNGETQDVPLIVSGGTIKLRAAKNMVIYLPENSGLTFTGNENITAAGDSLVYTGSDSYITLTCSDITALTSLSVKYNVRKEPFFKTDLRDRYGVNRGSELELSTVAANSPTYQWYSNTIESTEGATPISGATEATYSVPTTSVATTYYYCVATNNYGTAISNIAKVVVSNYVTFNYSAWDADDTEIGWRSDYCQGGRDGLGSKLERLYTWAYPYSLAGYMATLVDNTNINIAKGTGLNNSNSTDRSVAFLDLKSGDVLKFTGTNFTEVMFTYNSVTGDGSGRATSEVTINDEGTEAYVTMTSDGNFVVYLKGSTITEAMLPNKYAPTIITDLDGSANTLSRGGTKTLTVAATANDSNEITYQWYRKEGGLTNKDGEAIEGATEPSYTTPENTSYTYYCIVTNSGTGAVAASTYSRVQCAQVVTYTYDDAAIIGDAPAAETLAIAEGGSPFTVPVRNQSVYKPVYTQTGWTDGTNTYKFGQTYTINNDLTLTPVYVPNAVEFSALHGDVEVTWELDDAAESMAAPTADWSDTDKYHAIVAQASFDGTYEDLGLRVKDGNFNNTVVGDNEGYAFIAAGTTITMPGRHGLQLTITGKESTTPAVTFYAADLVNGTLSDGNIVLTPEDNVITYTYTGAESLVVLKFTENCYYKSISAVYPGATAPVYNTDLKEAYSTEKGTPITLSVVPVGAKTLQWYKNSTASTEGGVAISGATSASYTIDASENSESYYYVGATNSYGTTYSTIAAVRVFTYETFDFQNWDVDDLTLKNSSTKNGKVSMNNGSSSDGDIYELEYPYSLVGYLGKFNDGNIQIQSGTGLVNTGNNRGFALLNLKNGETVIFKGTGLTEDLFTYGNNNTTNNGRGTKTVEVNESGTEATLSMTSDGNLAMYLPKTTVIQSIKIPSKYAPVITTDVESNNVVDKNKEVTLSVEATLATDITGHSIAYQWYVNTTNSNKNGTAVDGATEASYTTTVDATKYYYCVVKNAATGAISVSSVATVGYYKNITFVNNDEAAYGAAPEAQKVQSGKSMTIPKNQTLYKKGYTLRAWSDGENEINVGETYIALGADEVTLTPVFSKNNSDASLARRTGALSVTWTFSTDNGSAKYYKDVASANVNQVEVQSGRVIDLGIKMTLGCDNVDEADMNNNGWMKATNSDFIVPVVNGTVLTISTYNASDITIGGETIEWSQATNGKYGNVTFVYTYTGDNGELTLNLGNNYVKSIKADYPAPPSLVATADRTDLTITEAKVKYRTAKITLSGENLVANKTYTVTSSESALTVTPATFTTTSTGSVEANFLVTYSSTSSDDGGAIITFADGESFAKELEFTYGRGYAYSGSTPDDVTTKTVWDWSGSSDIKPVVDSYMAFRDVSGTWAEGMSSSYNYLAGTGEYFAYQSEGSFQGGLLYFYNTKAGTLEVEFSNTGTSDVRYLNINGTNTSYRSNSTTHVSTAKIAVPKGGVTIQGRFAGQNDDEYPAQYLRIYKMTFTPNAETPTITLDKSTSSFTLSTTDFNLDENDNDKEEIYYTLDGTDPTVLEATKYEGGSVAIASNCTIKAIAVCKNKNDSEIASVTTEFETYELEVGFYPNSDYGHIEFIPAAENNMYTLNSKVKIHAIASTGYGFKGWTRTREQIGEALEDTAKFTSQDPTYEITIGESNIYWAVFSVGPKGTVTYDVTQAEFYNNEGTAKTDETYTSLIGNNTFQSSVTSTSIAIPTNYNLYHNGNAYTMDCWKDGSGKTYTLGDNKLFTEAGQNIILHPVYKANKYAGFMDTNTKSYTVTWDFRTGYGAHPTKIERGTAAEYVYATHATINYRDDQSNQYNDQVVDVCMKIVTDGNAASFTNQKISTWATMTEGTKLVLPSGYGAKYTLATYSPLKVTGGTTVNGVAPDNINDEDIPRDENGAYLYTWTVNSTDQESELVIGTEDYTYYEYVQAVIPNAQNKYLNYSSNNEGMGTVAPNMAGIKTTIGDEVVYSYTVNEDITLTATRNAFYELKYWLDTDGNKIYPNGYVVRAEQGDSVTLESLNNKVGVITYSKVEGNDIKFVLTNYLKLQAVFGDKKSYYINFSAGKAQGTALPQQHIEEGGQFVMPDNNQRLYLEGYTLKHYVNADDETKIYEFGESYDATSDLRLIPYFEQNTVSLADITTATTVKWPLTKDGGSESIYYVNANGNIVSQATIGTSVIDVNCIVSARGSGKKVVNTDKNDVCTISSAKLTIPTTTGCNVTVTTTGATISDVSIVGKTDYETSNAPTVEYTGTASTGDIVFSNSYDCNSISVVYNPVEVSSALASVAYGDVALTADQLATLNNNNSIEIECAARYEDDAMPTVSATAANGVTPTYVQATVYNPSATIYVKNNGGMTLKTYNVNFTFTGTSAPAVDTIRVNGYDAAENVVSTVQNRTDGVISLVFDHTMVSQNVTGLGQTLVGSAVGKTLNLTYWDLADGKHTLTIPAGTIADVYGQKNSSDITVTFTTNTTDETAVPQGTYDFVVTHRIIWDAKTQTSSDTIQVVSDDVIKRLKNMNVAYGTIDQATEMANAASGSNRFYIFVPDGEYNIRGNESGKFTEIPKHGEYSYGKGEDGNNSTTLELHIADYNDSASYYNGRTKITRNNVSIIGQSQDKTILYNDPYLYGREYCSAFDLNTGIENTYFQDMTIENRYCDFQVEAGKNPSAAVDKEGYTGAPAFYDRGTYTILKNVSLKGYEATYSSESHTGIANGGDYGNYPTGMFDSYRYYEDCSVWGTYFFVLGSGNAWWENPTIVLRKRTNTDCIVLAQHPDEETIGFVFNKGTVKTEDNATYNYQNGTFALAAPLRWAPNVTFLNTKFEITPRSAGWLSFMRENKVRFHEYGSLTANETTLDLTQRSISDLTPKAGSDDCVLTSTQAAAYNLRSMFGVKNAYDPKSHTKQMDMTNRILSQEDNTIKWTGMTAARGYVIFCQNEDTEEFEFYTMTDATSFVPDDSYDGRVFYVRAANERGGLGEPSNTITYKKPGSYTIEVKQVGPDEDWGWATVCLPENVKVPGNESQQTAEEESTENNTTGEIYVYAASNINGEDAVLSMTKVQKLVANQGYVIYAKPGKYTFTGTTENPGSDCESKLSGNPEDHAVSAGLINCYTLSYKPTINPEAPGFYKFTGSTIPAYRAYLTVETLAKYGYNVDTSGNAKGMTCVFEGLFGEEDADGIDSVRDDAASDDELIYDISGKRIERSQMRKGMIYIVNGEKIQY